MLIASLVYMNLVSCNNDANDGDAATDTMNTNSSVPQSAAPYGDTARDVNNEGNKTNLNMRTDVDSMSNSNQAADSSGGTSPEASNRSSGGRP